VTRGKGEENEKKREKLKIESAKIDYREKRRRE